MKKCISALVALLPVFASFSQNAVYSISILQDGKNVKIENGKAQLEKKPFAIIYEFDASHDWTMIAGNSATMKNAFKKGPAAFTDLILNAGSAGASGYFNEGKDIRACDVRRETQISFNDRQSHSFDSLYAQGKSLYGVRTVEFLETDDNTLLVEEWNDSILILATAITQYTTEGKSVSEPQAIKLILKDVPLSSQLDVRGKKYAAKPDKNSQPTEGCEGCGNPGSINFLKNGKTADFLPPGSDIIFRINYIQNGNQIHISENDSKHSFTVSENGKKLTDNEYGTAYFLVK